MKERDGLEDNPSSGGPLVSPKRVEAFTSPVTWFKVCRRQLLLETMFSNNGCQGVGGRPKEARRCAFFCKDSLLKFYSEFSEFKNKVTLHKNPNVQFLFKVQKSDKTGPTFPNDQSAGAKEGLLSLDKVYNGWFATALHSRLHP